MKNRDTIRNDIRTKIAAALGSQDSEQLATTLTDLFVTQAEDLAADMASARASGDDQILAARGARPLTSEEKSFYNKVLEAMKAADPKAALTMVTSVLPVTIFNQVLEDIIKEFPILEAIDLVDAGTVSKMLVNGQSVQLAAWGALGSAITRELSAAFTTIDVTKNKLSAYIPVTLDMIQDADLQWVDTYVRAILTEAYGSGLAAAVIKGNGLTEPVGMIKDLSAAVDQTTGYADKTKTAVTSLDGKKLSKLVSGLALTATGRPRVISEVLMVCNPVDYYNKIIPALMVLTADGTYKVSTPFPVKIIQDINLAQGDMVVGIGKNYKMFAGTPSRLEYSDEYQFIEDNRVYKIKGHGNGRPLDNTSFLYCDISNLA